LCATDFSDCSLNAVRWIFQLLENMEEIEIEIVNCLEPFRKGVMVAGVLDLYEERAKKLMSKLEDNLKLEFKRFQITTSVHKAVAKAFLAEYANQRHFDLIITGTTGLTSLKDILIGSVTEYLFMHSRIPVLAIPINVKYEQLKKVVFGLGQDELRNLNKLEIIYSLLSLDRPKIFLSQVIKKHSNSVKIDIRLEDYFKDLSYEYVTLERNSTVNKTLYEFCSEVDAGLICMLHINRGWLENLVHKSIVKEELYSIEIPLLILPV